MNIFVCIDDRGGMLFNHRRQSKDQILRAYILKRCAGQKLRMNTYSAKQFAPEDACAIHIEDSFLQTAQAGDFCFVEDEALLPYEKDIETIYLYRWNRTYPADTYFDISLIENGWKLISSAEFEGCSHEKITEEVYRK